MAQDPGLEFVTTILTGLVSEPDFDTDPADTWVAGALTRMSESVEMFAGAVTATQLVLAARPDMALRFITGLRRLLEARAAAVAPKVDATTGELRWTVPAREAQ